MFSAKQHNGQWAGDLSQGHPYQITCGCLAWGPKGTSVTWRLKCFTPKSLLKTRVESWLHESLKSPGLSFLSQNGDPAKPSSQGLETLGRQP